MPRPNLQEERSFVLAICMILIFGEIGGEINKNCKICYWLVF